MTGMTQDEFFDEMVAAAEQIQPTGITRKYWEWQDRDGGWHTEGWSKQTVQRRFVFERQYSDGSWMDRQILAQERCFLGATRS